MAYRVKIPVELLDHLPRTCVITGKKENVIYEDVTLNVTSGGHAAADAAGSIMIGMLLPVRPTVQVETMSLKLPYESAAHERVQKHRKINVLFMCLAFVVVLVGLLSSIHAATSRRRSAARALIIWGVSSLVSLTAAVVHKRSYAQDVTCYGRRFNYVGLSIPSKGAADGIKAVVRAFKETGRIPPRP